MEKVKKIPMQIQLESFQKYTEEQMQAMSHRLISELDLSTNAKNTLVQNNCFRLDEVAAFTEDKLINTEGSGNKTAVEIISAMDNWLNNNLARNLSDTENSLDFSEEMQEILQMLSVVLEPITQIRKNQLVDAVREARDTLTAVRFQKLTTKQKVSVILRQPSMRSSLETFWRNRTQQGIIKISEFKSVLAQIPLDFDAQLLIQCSMGVGVIREIGEYYLMERPTVSEFLDSGVFNDQTIQILKMRLNGAKLQAIGNRFGLSREGVRQIVAKKVNRFPLLLEDYFVEPFQEYCFTKNEFNYLFPEASEEGFGYLNERYKKGKISFSEAGPDEYSGFWNERISNFIRGKNKIKKGLYNTQKEVILDVLNDNYNNPLTIDLFKTEYDKRIEQMAQYSYDNNLRIKTLKANSKGTLNNFLRSEKGVVFNCENKVRLCEADPKSIWETINFYQYRDLVVSAELIYKDYLELMAAQQIRDGYELFYVIKNSLDLWNGNFCIRFRRVPIIEIGETSEADQAIQLLKDISPVSHSEYFTNYEEQFGVRKKAAQGNRVIKKALSPYSKGKEYIIDATTVSEI